MTLITLGAGAEVAQPVFLGKQMILDERTKTARHFQSKQTGRGEGVKKGLGNGLGQLKEVTREENMANRILP